MLCPVTAGGYAGVCERREFLSGDSSPRQAPQSDFEGAWGRPVRLPGVGPEQWQLWFIECLSTEGSTGEATGVSRGHPVCPITPGSHPQGFSRAPTTT